MRNEFDQLMETNLKGYTYNDMTEGYTMTGWGTIDNYMVVIEDNGDTCVVAELDNKSRTKQFSKRYVAKMLCTSSLYVWNAESRQYDHKIVEV